MELKLVYAYHSWWFPRPYYLEKRNNRGHVPQKTKVTHFLKWGTKLMNPLIGLYVLMVGD